MMVGYLTKILYVMCNGMESVINVGTLCRWLFRVCLHNIYLHYTYVKSSSIIKFRKVTNFSLFQHILDIRFSKQLLLLTYFRFLPSSEKPSVLHTDNTSENLCKILYLMGIMQNASGFQCKNRANYILRFLTAL